MTKLDIMSADEIKNGLNTSILGNTIYCYSETSSTNDIALKLAHEGTSEGALVIAEKQTHGRGRRERKWIAPMGTGILVSIILRPQITINEANVLTLMTASAVAKSILSVAELPARIKWPNDIVINDKKVSGVLTEARVHDRKLSFIVLGIGITVNISKEKLPDEIKDVATSLSIQKGNEISRIALLQEVLRQIESRYLCLRSGDLDKPMQEWKGLSSTTGSQVKISLPKRIVYGLAEDIDQTGALLVRLGNNQVQRFTANEVVHLRHV